MIRLAAIDHVVFRVADLDASLRFYAEALGATLVGRNPAPRRGHV